MAERRHRHSPKYCQHSCALKGAGDNVVIKSPQTRAFPHHAQHCKRVLRQMRCGSTGGGGGTNATAPTPSPTYQGTQHAAAPFAQLATDVKLTVVSSSRTRCRAIARRVRFATVMGSVPTEDMWGCCAIVGVSSEGLRGLMCNSGRVRKVRQRRKQKSPHGCGPQNPATEMRTWRSLTYIHATQRK